MTTDRTPELKERTCESCQHWGKPEILEVFGPHAKCALDGITLTHRVFGCSKFEWKK